MGSRVSIKNKVLSVFSDGKPRSAKDVVACTGLKELRVWNGLSYWWKRGLLLRSEKPAFDNVEVFKGRGGLTRNTRTYYLYVLKPEERSSLHIEGRKFVSFRKELLDSRGARETSKAKMILDFLKENNDKAFFSVEIAKTLADKAVKIRDVMATIRRYESLVYVRGYRTEQGQTPFKNGYILTWIDQEKPREQAIEEAVKRTNMVLESEHSTSPVIERIHLIRDLILEATKLRDLVSFEFLQNRLGCSLYEAENAVARALQIYPDLRETKLFDAYKYYYHASISEEDLRAAIALKQNYVRIVKGRQNRIGHNWEACVEWFIDKYTTGAVFQTQNHRTKVMDPRRITLHLLKGVGGRRQNAEVDRVWSVTPGVFAQPITYVLECKWGLVRKREVDDFLEVLRWSNEFGVSTSEGRQIKQGVVGVFAGSAFNPQEKVKLKDETEMSLATYAARINIQLLKASDFNEKLRDRAVPKEITVQAVCKTAKDEKEVRELLQAIWENPEKSSEILSKAVSKNKDVYDFEKMLEKT
ncbi:MAG: hypothetical protein NWE99_02420 [Candidatus Bathyarchaeota archaeon]|nr:hypothetical protein [Candidatus Bathyarchaeota archaeon]